MIRNSKALCLIKEREILPYLHLVWNHSRFFRKFLQKVGCKINTPRLNLRDGFPELRCTTSRTLLTTSVDALGRFGFEVWSNSPWFQCNNLKPLLVSFSNRIRKCRCITVTDSVFLNSRIQNDFSTATHAFLLAIHVTR